MPVGFTMSQAQSFVRDRPSTSPHRPVVHYRAACACDGNFSYMRRRPCPSASPARGRAPAGLSRSHDHLIDARCDVVLPFVANSVSFDESLINKPYLASGGEPQRCE
jgi:hypothetical protein